MAPSSSKSWPAFPSSPSRPGLPSAPHSTPARGGGDGPIAFEASHPAVLARLADRGLGIAVLPADENLAASGAAWREIPITHPQVRGRLASPGGQTRRRPRYHGTYAVSMIEGLKPTG